jgi:hypothetical protein
MKGIENCQVSRYELGIISKEQAAEGISLIVKTKPKINNYLVNLIIEEMVVQNWNYQKMIDAIKHVALNNPYPEPQACDYLNYDLFDELYTYQQMMDKVGREAYVTMDFFQFIRKVGETSLYKFLGYDKTKEEMKP